jgi:oxygen-dependent protoporphyrinogen oxidase
MEERKIQVVGGGFAGLSLAYFLSQKGRVVRLVEKSGRMGGMIRTLNTPYGPVETAANALLSSALVERTAGELGISLVPALPAARRRLVFRNGKARRWPLSFGASLRMAGFAGRFLYAKAGLKPRPGETLAAWGNRCLGSEATTYLFGPAFAGVFAAGPESLSASLVLERFLSGRQAARGKRRGSVAPLHGMEEWARGFRAYLQAKGTEFSNQEEEGLETVVALPPQKAKEFLAGRAPRLERALEKIEPLPLLTATCFFSSASPSLGAFGCLFPPGEGIRALGVLSNHDIFPGRAKGALSETWIFGGARDKAVLDLSDEEIQAEILRSRSRIHGRAGDLLHGELTRWPQAVPHYNLGLEESVQELNALSFRENGFTLFGTYLGDLGLARVLQRAESLADHL